MQKYIKNEFFAKKITLFSDFACVIGNFAFDTSLYNTRVHKIFLSVIYLFRKAIYRETFRQLNNYFI